MSRNSAFNQGFKAILAKAKGKQDLICRAVALELVSRITAKTPVDEGRLKSNWQVGISAVNADTSASPGDDAVKRAGPVVERFVSGNRIFITNSLPYAKPIEFGLYPNPPKGGEGKTEGGFSRQAPGGMVRLSIQEYGQILRDIARKMK